VLVSAQDDAGNAVTNELSLPEFAEALVKAVAEKKHRVEEASKQ
jgi:hypothetical protein